MNPKKSIILLFICICALLGAEDAVSLRLGTPGKWYQVERSNWSRYDNGKYTGLTHRETRSLLSVRSGLQHQTIWSGSFYVLEETLRDMSAATRSLNDIVDTEFTLTNDGRMTVTKDNGYPRLRNFPVVPENPVTKGDVWEATGERAVDPNNDGNISVMPIEVSYTFIGEETYKGELVYRLRAKYATRISTYNRPRSIHKDLKAANGTHDVDILISAESGSPILMLDKLDETFTYADSSTVRFRGSTAIFSEHPIPVDRRNLVKAIEKQGAKTETIDTGKPTELLSASEPQPVVQTDMAKKEPEKKLVDTKNITSEPFIVENTPRGVRLSVRDIRFIADSDTILPDEAWRVDAIAEVLKQIPGGKFLIEGHTADVGNPTGEKKLSIARAEKIAAELTQRGLKADQFLCAGYGGTRPVSDNKTAQGRSLNRRVEITILE